MDPGSKMELGLWDAVADPILVPRELMLSGTIEDGSWWSAAITAADGACGLHSVWGDVVASSSGNFVFLQPY